MFDRVFICPDCGKADGLLLISTDRFCVKAGVGVAIYCSHCDLSVLSADLSWKLAHLFLRASLIEARTVRGVYHPTDWRPILSWKSLGNTQKACYYRMISDCWMEYFHHRDECTLKLSAQEMYALLFNVVFSLTAGSTGDRPSIGIAHWHDYVEDRHDVASASP